MIYISALKGWKSIIPLTLITILKNMTTPLNLYLCLEDSPDFRKELSECENSIFGLEATIKSLIKLIRSSVELASEYTAKQLQFAEEFGNFAKQQPDSLIKTILSKYANSLQEIERSRKILQSHMYSMFVEPLEAFVKNGIIPLKEMKKVVEKASYDADSALAKYMGKRPRDAGIFEASLEVSETRKEFHNQYLDYVIKINELEAKKKFEFMEYVKDFGSNVHRIVILSSKLRNTERHGTSYERRYKIAS
ncbi:hypothetical protein RclHR1_06510011 [Rhizophagus clarus]|uniref:BAR domain-containing protein n=1 Tax=Rhizophagus clarus TaxID=94130 RepID=A0A2Z6RT63_9GLOM|nr:hypothetical protein RclHR1_06510011 [Rhizophagus clarus]